MIDPIFATVIIVLGLAFFITVIVLVVGGKKTANQAIEALVRLGSNKPKPPSPLAATEPSQTAPLPEPPPSDGTASIT